MHKIMVVEDDANMRTALKFRLERSAYGVRTARDGAEALNMALPDPPDLIILDLMLPKVDGFEVLRHLKSNHLTADIPVIILTSRASPAFRDKSYALGAAEFLAKPFSPRHLVAEIDALLREPSGLARGRQVRLPTEQPVRHGN